MEPQEKENNSIGNLKSLSTTLNNMNFKNLEVRMLSLYVGANGTGKTFILILNWIGALIAAVYAHLNNNNVPKKIYEDLLQFVLDNSFSKNDFTGETEILFDNLTVTFALDNGKVTSLDFQHSKKVNVAAIPQFLSTNTRLFDDVVKYIRFKHALGIKGNLNISTEEDIRKLSGIYKIFDVLFMETLILKLSTGLVLQEEISDIIFKQTSKKIVSMLYDADKMDIFYTDDKKVTKSVLTLGAGEQSYINMIIANQR